MLQMFTWRICFVYDLCGSILDLDIDTWYMNKYIQAPVYIYIYPYKGYTHHIFIVILYSSNT